MKLVYGREVESDALWFQHTFLVIVAKCIALAVLGLKEDDPKRLSFGRAFQSAGISGAVESDFFDWAVADAGGEELVRRIMNSCPAVPPRRSRKRCSQNPVRIPDRPRPAPWIRQIYTPDWLAAKMVKRVIDRPLVEHVLDPACGSGTFLFHAIRVFLHEAGIRHKSRGSHSRSLRARRGHGHSSCRGHHLALHFVALFSLAPALKHRKGGLSIPVYLGDAMQLSISEIGRRQGIDDSRAAAASRRGTSGTRDAIGRAQLDFPDNFCRDPALFDKAIERMRSGSEAGMTRAQIEKALYRITEQHYRADVTNQQKLAIADLGKTYVTFDKLRREGRNSVWAYVARNLSRPLAFSASGGWASVVIGNPPWVAYRHMSVRFAKALQGIGEGRARLCWSQASPSQNDLLRALYGARDLTLFALRRPVLPSFFPWQPSDPRTVRETAFWLVQTPSTRITMGRGRGQSTMAVQPLFPVPSCVVFGRRRARLKAIVCPKPCAPIPVRCPFGTHRNGLRIDP